MLDLTDLESEAEALAAQLRLSRCCDALMPCYRCSLLKFNVLARRRVVEVPRPKRRVRSPRVMGPLALAARVCDLELRAS
ncbi:MAG TPA: hypothetical protein VLB29_06395 [Nocardioidaceae bacterium]|nr:hypothetical protein [Nocardioidaceae bacterium]